MKTNLILARHKAPILGVWGLLFCLLLLSGCEKKEEAVTGIELTPVSDTLMVGSTLNLTATVTPNNAANKAIEWESSNPTVATVVSTGLVTAMAPGTATIVVSTVDGNKTASCVLTIIQPVTGVSLNQTAATLTTGGTMTLTPTVMPTNATNKAVSWKSSNTNVATVNNNGKVTAITVGTATVTVTTQDGNKTATCALTVEAATVAVESVLLDVADTTLTAGGTFTLTPAVLPTDATNKTVTWESSNPNVATVVSTGLITALTPGKASIVATTADGGKTATCVLTVTQPVTGVSLNQTAATLTAGGTMTLTPTITPADVINKNVNWTSSNTNVATVDNNGKVTAIAVGTATVTVTTQDGNKTATCAVTVTQPATGIKLDKTIATLNLGGTMTLIATVLPDNAANKAVTWSSNNPAIATVTDGVVTAIAAGTTTITATAQDGSNKSASCTLTVNPATVAVTGITLNQTTATLTAGGTLTLTPMVLPADATNKAVSWTSSNTAVATVNNGVVKAIAEGVTIITVTTQDSGKTATCVVRVVPPQMTMTTENNNRIRMTIRGTGTATVNWGDGATQDYILNSSSDRNISHNYHAAANYTMTIAGGNITYLSCSSNQLTSLDVSNNTALTRLDCYENQLTSLNVSGCTALTYLNCSGIYDKQGLLTSLDVSKNTVLTYLNCGYNQLTSLDVSKNIALTYLNCGHNQLTSLNVNSCTALTDLDCWGNQLTSLDVSKNTALTRLYCWGNQLTSLDVSKNTALVNLDCGHNQLTALYVSNNIVLSWLDCSGNQLTALYVSNPAIAYLRCGENQLKADALNALFGSLHSNTVYGKIIYIYGNPGTGTCVYSLAQNKGWRVNTTTYY